MVAKLWSFTCAAKKLPLFQGNNNLSNIIPHNTEGKMSDRSIKPSFAVLKT